MSKINTFDKQNLKSVRIDIDAALKTVADKYGIKLSIGTIRFDGNQFNTKLSAATDTAISATIAVNEMFGLAPIGTRFIAQGVIFEVTKHEPSRPKYPIVAKRSNGKLYKFTNQRVIDGKIG